MPTNCDGYRKTMCGLEVHVIDVSDSDSIGQSGGGGGVAPASSTRPDPACSLIFLPGRGSLGSKYADRYNTGQFVLPSPTPAGGVRIIFPSSPLIDEHQDLPTWFRYADLPAKGIDSAERYVLSDIEYSAGMTANLVMHEVGRCGWARTFLGGHSQGSISPVVLHLGAMLALHIQLTHLSQPLAGLCLFSGYLVHPLRQLIALAERGAAMHLACNLDLMRSHGRVFAWHGELDDNFPSDTARALYQRLFAALGCEGALKMCVEAPGVGHSPVPPGAYASLFAAMLAGLDVAPSS